MSDCPGHPDDGNYASPGYGRAVSIYFWTMLAIAVIVFATYIEVNK